MTETQPAATRIAMFSSSTEITSRVEAARTLNVVDGPALYIYDLDAGNHIQATVDVYAQRKAFGRISEPQVNWSAFGSVDGATARRYAEMIALAAELITLAAELAR